MKTALVLGATGLVGGRLLEQLLHDARYDSVVALTRRPLERQHPTEPHYYLAMLGTDPAHQGRGIGSALLAPVLERCDEEGLPAYLESSKESNIAFYARHRFDLTKPFQLKGGPTMYFMWRPAPA